MRLRAALPALAVAVLLTAPAAALPMQTLAAAPGAWLTTYATPVLAVTPGDPLTFTNGDIMRHDVVSTATGPDDSLWCDRYPDGACPLFWSRLIGLGESTAVLGLAGLEGGQTYDFYCTIHDGMTGVLVALPTPSPPQES